MPLFSVIIPTYNRVDLLPQALDSVWKQTLTDFEVIIVDDGSTDGTSEYLRRLGNRVRTYTQPNRGPGTARNLAAEHAKGRYLAFLDSDDLWFPWTLACQHAALTRHNGPSMTSGRSVPLVTGVPPDSYFTGALQTRYFNSLLEACDGPVLPLGGSPSIVMRREAFVRLGGFVQGCINGEDTDLWLRAGAEQGFVAIAKPPMFAQRVHSFNITNHSNRSLRGMEHLFAQESAGRYPGGHLHRRRRIDILAANARVVSLRVLASGHLGGAWSVYKTAFRWHLELHRWKYLIIFPTLAWLSGLGLRRAVRRVVQSRGA